MCRVYPGPFVSPFWSAIHLLPLASDGFQRKGNRFMNFAIESMQIVAATQTRMYICQLRILFFWEMTIVQNDNQTDLFRMGVVQIFCATGSSFFYRKTIPIV